MTKSFKNLLDLMSERLRECVEDHAQQMLIEMALQDIRQRRDLTQQQLANGMKLNQAAVSKMERQTDMYVSTLHRVINAMGGKLKLVAEFPDEEIVINQFGIYATQ